jgi:hypothetical protein
LSLADNLIAIGFAIIRDRSTQRNKPSVTEISQKGVLFVFLLCLYSLILCSFGQYKPRDNLSQILFFSFLIYLGYDP